MVDIKYRSILSRPNVPRPFTHPAHLTTMARLFSMPYTDPAHCRVLELGCAGGENLIPMAYSLPGSKFVGIDISSQQADRGIARINRLGLRNITLHAAGLDDVGTEFGQFDYIILDGAYSWLSDPLRERSIAICAERLAPYGIVFVSYDTYPGWHMRSIFRDMARYHTRDIDDPEERIEQARELVEFIGTMIPFDPDQRTEYDAYGMTMVTELERIQNIPDTVLSSGLLEGMHQPVYFNEFMTHAARYGLQYLGDARFSTMCVSNFPPSVATELEQITSTLVDIEQYMDSLQARMFRESLLCHQDIPLFRNLNAAKIAEFYIASPCVPVETPEDSQAPIQFKSPRGMIISISDPLDKAAMLYMAEVWPRAVRFDELLAVVRNRVASPQSLEDDSQILGDQLLNSYAADLIELHAMPPPFTFVIDERPHASAVARLEAAESGNVTSLRHEPIMLEHANDRQFLALLDGTRDRIALRNAMLSAVANGLIDLEIRQIDSYIDITLQRLARQALLEYPSKEHP